jgi:non-ribosomal peptide synthetase component F
MSGTGSTEWIRVSAESTEAMHNVARLADATLNMTLLALYYVLLSGMAGEFDLVVGTPVRGRNQTEVESVMGYFNNLLPLHMTVDPALPFIDFVGHVKRTAIESFGHPDVPLEYLQRELKVDRRRGAVLYQALFSFQDARQRIVDWGGLQHEQILLFQSGATEDLGLWFLEGAKGMIGGVTYNADILDADTARQLRERYLTMLSGVIADPEQSVTALLALAGGNMTFGNTSPPESAVPLAVQVAASSPASLKSPAEQLLVRIWAELLGAVEIRATDNFFDIGGHSLMAVDMATRVQNETGVQLNLLDIANGTLGTLAAELSAAQAKADQPAKLGVRLRRLFGKH